MRDEYIPGMEMAVGMGILARICRGNVRMQSPAAGARVHRFSVAEAPGNWGRFLPRNSSQFTALNPIDTHTHVYQKRA